MADLDVAGVFTVTGREPDGGLDATLEFSLPTVAPLSFAVPAVGSFTIAHGLGRRPVGPVFYDLSGSECIVGFACPDLNTLDVLQDAPTEGTVVFQ